MSFPTTWSGAQQAAQLGINQQQANTQQQYAYQSHDLGTQRLKLEEQSQKNAEQRALFERADKERAKLMGHVVETIQALKIAGKDDATIAKAIQPLVQPLKRLTKSSGGDDSVIDAQIATTLAQPADAKTMSAITKPVKMGTDENLADRYSSFSTKTNRYEPVNLTDPRVTINGISVEDAPLPRTGNRQFAAAGDVKEDTQAAKPVDVMAETYYQTGQFPPGLRGQKSQAIRDRLIQRAIELHPDIPVSEWPKRQQEFKSQQVAINRFMSGPQGNTIRSLNVVVDHLGTLDKLGEALENGNVQLFNSVAQQWAQQTGMPAPTNFDMAKMIVGTELVKAMGVAGAGTKDEREDLGRRVSRASSPAQLNGVIRSVAQPLLVGQLKGLRQQFAASTGLSPSRFDDMIGTEAKKFFGEKTSTEKSNPTASGTSGGVKWSIEP